MSTHRRGPRPSDIPRPLLAGLLALGFAGETTATSAQSFQDVTAAAGLTYQQYASLGITEPEAHFLTGGAAAADYDGDGWIDLYVTCMDDLDILFRNLGDGTFASVPAATTGLVAGDGSNGAAWGDVDDDGDFDLYVTTVHQGANLLFINDGSGSFTEEAAARGVDIGWPNWQQARGFGATFGDYDRDGYLDLHTCSWADDEGVGSRLFRNRGRVAPGVFDDVTEAAGTILIGIPNRLGSPDWSFAFTSEFVHVDGDAHPDLVVAGDFGTSRIFWNDGDGTFTDGTVAAGFGTDENGMGLALGDYDADGRIDAFVTSIYDPLDTCSSIPCGWGSSGNRLYRNLGGRQFADATDAMGVRDGGWGWGTAFFDAENDGDLDLVMTNGIVFPQIPEEDLFNTDPMRLWRTVGPPAGPPSDPFQEVAAIAGLTATGPGKALITFDYDRDGDLDLFVVHTAGQAVLYRNDAAPGAWLQVALRGTISNRFGLGGRLRAVADGRTHRRRIGASGYLSQGPAEVSFGLGAASRVDSLCVTWPSGIEQTLVDVAVDQRITLVEPPPTAVVEDGHPASSRPHLRLANPYAARGPIQFTLQDPSRVTLDVYDLRGRHVESLLATRLAAGRHDLRWDARDSAGRPMPSGVYFLRLIARDQEFVRKIQLVP